MFWALVMLVKLFLTAAIDPFHDEEIPNLRGLPDGLNSRSCVQIVRASRTFSCPATITTGTWDCQIVSLPFPVGIKCKPFKYLMDQNYQFQGLAQEWGDAGNTDIKQIGPIGAYSGATPLNINVAGTGSLDGMATIAFPINLQGSYRIISKGWEVISSGPDLYKSGVVSVWNQPVSNNNEVTTTFLSNNGGVTMATTRETLGYDMFPLSFSSANSIPNSQQWPSKEGVYVVDRMQEMAQPTDWFASRTFMLVNNDWTAVVDPNGYGEVTGFSPPAAYTKWGSSADAVSHGFMDSVPKTNFGISGAFFTGLNLQDTLTINAIWYVERVPDIEQLDLLLLSSPTPCVDRVALDIYSYLAGVMPAGMYQRANGFGDWFKDAVSVITDVVAPVASALPGPIGAIAKGATMIGGAVKKFLPDSKSENSPAPYSEVERPIVIDGGRNDNLIVRPSKGNKKLKSKLRKEDGKALMDLNSLKQELKSMRTKMKKKKKK